MFKKRKKNEIEDYKDETMNMSSKEEEIMESYQDLDNEEIIADEDITEKEIDNDSYDYEDYIMDDEKIRKRDKRIGRAINIIFAGIVILLIMVAADVILVAKYEIGPFFAIPLYTYNDGGTKEYYGLGYKVIKYNQFQGRRDKEIGYWSLKYNDDAKTYQDVDLSIELNDEDAKSYDTFYKKFVRIISTLKKVDTKKRQITIGYEDEGNKYSLNIVCKMVKDQKDLKKLEKGKEITIIGTIKDIKGKSKKNPTTVVVENCFAEQ